MMDTPHISTAAEELIAAHRESSLLLSDLIQEFTVSLNQHQTLDNALDRICEHLDAEAGSVFLLQENDELVCSVSAGPVDLTGLRIPASQGIVGRTIASGQVIMVRDTGSHPDFAAEVDAKTGFVTRSVLCAPLMIRDTRLGAIELINKRGGDSLFSDTDRDTLLALASATSLAVHNTNMARALIEQERIQRELRLAREIQESLLPAATGQQLPVRGINIPANEVSGDFYDYLELADGRICFCLGDVSGKGINAALLMSKASSLFHCLAKTINSPGALLNLINNELCETATRGMFVTMVTGIYNPDTNTVEIANAGHMPPLLMEGENRFSEIKGSAPPLGIVTNQQYTSQSVLLSDGMLILYSDGISEMRVSDSQVFGLEGLKSTIKDAGSMTLEPVFSSVTRQLYHLSDHSHDDMTLLVISGKQSDYKTLDRFSSEATPEQLKHIRQHVEKSCQACGYDQAATNNIVLAVDEACSNIIRHAYRGSSNGNIHIAIARDTDHMIIQLDDNAPSMNPRERQTTVKDRKRVGGLGLALIDKIMDETEFRTGTRNGNSLVMRKHLPRDNK